MNVGCKHLTVRSAEGQDWSCSCLSHFWRSMPRSSPNKQFFSAPWCYSSDTHWTQLCLNWSMVLELYPRLYQRGVNLLAHSSAMSPRNHPLLSFRLSWILWVRCLWVGTSEGLKKLVRTDYKGAKLLSMCKCLPHCP